MKTVRFSNVVGKCGEPTTHLILVDPAKDKILQAAIKAQKVMTVFQAAVGNKTDRGEIGFQPGRSRQFLVFQKSLKSFAGRTVVGIKYDMLSSAELPKSKQAAPARPPKKTKRKPGTAPVKKEAPPRHKAENVVAFKPAAEPEEEDGESEEVEDIKKKIRHAMTVLEQGKQVAAFNLLKRIVDG